MLADGPFKKKRVWNWYVTAIHASDAVLHVEEGDNAYPSETMTATLHTHTSFFKQWRGNVFKIGKSYESERVKYCVTCNWDRSHTVLIFNISTSKFYWDISATKAIWMYTCTYKCLLGEPKQKLEEELHLEKSSFLFLLILLINHTTS